jgi:hypothetical protein
MSPQGSKLARAQAGAPEVEAGNYHIPNGPMGDAFIEEERLFRTEPTTIK